MTKNAVTHIVYKTNKQRKAIRTKATEGLKCIGYGAFARVYSSKSLKHVIKIGNLDDKYLSYAREVFAANSKNPFLPKIHSITIVKCDRSSPAMRDDFYIVKMERLSSLAAKQTIRRQVTGAIEHAVMYGAQRILPKEENIPGIYETEVKVKPDAIANLEELQRIAKKAKGRRKDTWWDIHWGNVMLRGGHPVLTDPLC